MVKNKLRQLSELLGFDNYRAFCDSAPVLERYWAVKAGLGWTGRNHQLIIPRAGSMFFLGELFLPVELDYDEPMTSRCGKCHACVDACPTHALRMGEGSEDNEEKGKRTVGKSHPNCLKKWEILFTVATAARQPVHGTVSLNQTQLPSCNPRMNS